MNNIHFGHGTHLGLVRQRNEDSYICLPDIGLWVIADGLGGHSGGDVASNIAVEEIARNVRHGKSLTESIETAHHSIQAAAQQSQTLMGMGSTVVALKIDGVDYEVAWVGDSRAYLWNGLLYRRTKDHSYIQMLIDTGVLSDEEASSHPNRNLISQALGTGGTGSDEIKVDTVSGKLAKNDTLLLCSDGLSGELSDNDIAAILVKTKVNQARVDRLIAAALKGGGRDNITVIILTAV